MNDGNACGLLSADISSAVCRAYPVEALLAGALALLEEDVNKGAGGNALAVLQIIEIAKERAVGIWMASDELHLIERATKIEATGING